VTWLGVQKWYFNFLAHYAARSWSVTYRGQNTSPSSTLNSLKFMIPVAHPGLLGKNLLSLTGQSPIPLMSASSNQSQSITRADGTSVSLNGIKYTSYARPFPIFEPFIGSLFSSGDDDVLLRRSGFGWITFETVIPIENEEVDHFGGRENANRYDNDCSEPGCDPTR
jgi:hypothetical protein